MKIVTSLLLGAGLAALCFASVEAKVSRKALLSVEGAMNDKFRTMTQDPFDLLGTARGTYLDGYGALFTVELQLVVLPPLTPFRPIYTPEELSTMHDRKVKKLPQLKEMMRGLLAGAATSLDSLPPTERISMETVLFHYRWEDTKGIPERIMMTAERGKLAQAVAAHTDLASVIEVREQ